MSVMAKRLPRGWLRDDKLDLVTRACSSEHNGWVEVSNRSGKVHSSNAPIEVVEIVIAVAKAKGLMAA